MAQVTKYYGIFQLLLQIPAIHGEKNIVNRLST